MLLSVVIPIYNEVEGIENFHKNYLEHTLNKLDFSYEIIYINDGSKDQSLQKLSKIAKKSKNVKVLNLSRNFGKEIATTAGIHHAKGDAIIIMDADGQHPPKYIPEFIKKYQNGAQVVVGVREKQHHEGIVKSLGSRLFYMTFNNSSGERMKPRSTDYRLISKSVKNEFVKLKEPNRITRGLIDWLGFNRQYISFDSPNRLAGSASYKTSQLIKLAANSFVSLSLRPLFIIGYFGAFTMLTSLFLGIFIIFEQYVFSDPLNLNFSGPFMLGVFMTFLISTVLLTQGLLALYISHIHIASQRRPLFIVDEENSINI